MDQIRVLIVDDNFVVRTGLRSSLETDPGITVLGEASDGIEALQSAEELLPDIVIMDIRMPRLNGIAATRRLAEVTPNVRVLVLTWSNNTQHLIDAIVAGAKGYLLHGTFGPAELAQAVRTIHQGGALITPHLAPVLLKHVQELSSKANASYSDSDAGYGSLLTHRETAVLELIQAGASNQEIAEQLGIEEKTVKNHINNIYSKLHFRSRYDAIMAGLRSVPRS